MNQIPDAEPAESGAAADTRLLEELEQQIARAWIQRDRNALEQILAPEWVVTQADGTVLTRSEVLGRFFDTVAFDSNVVDDVTVTLFGESAVVRGRTSVKAQVSGQPVIARIRFTDVFVKREGEWRVVASHASALGS